MSIAPGLEKIQVRRLLVNELLRQSRLDLAKFPEDQRIVDQTVCVVLGDDAGRVFDSVLSHKPLRG